MYGMNFARYAKSLAVAHGNATAAIGYAEGRDDWNGDVKRAVVDRVKASVGGLEAASVAGGSVEADLLAAVRELSVLLRLPLRRVQAQTPLLTQTTRPRAYMVNVGGALKLVAGAYARDGEGLTLGKVGAIVVASNEALSDPSFAADEALRVDLVSACAEALDRAFLDPDNIGADGGPASITSGATPIAFTGGGAEALDEALRQALQQLAAASNLLQAYWVMPSALAASLSLARGLAGDAAYPKLGALGGELAGLPVLTSGVAPAGSIVLLDASQISYADEAPKVGIAHDAMIEMDDSPTGNSVTPTAASAHLVSLFQEDAAGVKLTQRAGWKARRAGVVQIIEGVTADLGSSSSGS